MAPPCADGTLRECLYELEGGKLSFPRVPYSCLETDQREWFLRGHYFKPLLSGGIILKIIARKGGFSLSPTNPIFKSLL